MAALVPSIVVVGHGALGGVAELRVQHAYLADMVDTVRRGIAEGKSAAEIAQADMTRHKIGADKERNVVSLNAIYRKSKQ
jgi:hypothetical protein